MPASPRRTSRPRRRLIAAMSAILLLASGCSLIGGAEAAEDDIVITATVERTANLFVGSEVRVLGLPVGEVSGIEPQGDTVEVELTLDGSRDYPADVNVRLTPQSLLGERFAALDPPYTSGPTLETGAHVPMARTGIPAEVDEVLRSFEEFLQALDGDALAELIDVLADTLDGNGEGLNDLVASGSQTVRVLADSSVDLNQLVRDLAALNETIATREETIGSTLVNTSTTLRNLQEDRDLLIAALNELQRSLSEIQPVIAEHGDPLVRDLDTLATTLSTVDRNLDRVGTALFGARRLFTTAGRVIDYENARLPLDNEAGFLTEAIQDRIEDRLIGLCLRLDLGGCETVQEVLDLLPDLCLPVLCSQGGLPLEEGIATALRAFPPEAIAVIAADIEARNAAAAAQPVPTITPGPGVQNLPAPDERLEGRDSVPEEDDEARVPLLPSILGGGDDEEDGR